MFNSCSRESYYWSENSFGWGSPPDNCDEVCAAANRLIDEYFDAHPDAVLDNPSEVADDMNKIWEEFCQTDEINGVRAIWNESNN